MLIVFLSISALLCLAIYGVFLIDYRNPGAYARLHGKSVRMIREGLSEKTAETFFADKDLDKVPRHWRPLARLILSMGEGNKVYSGNSFEIMTSGERKRELLIEDIKNARKFIHIEYFRFGNDKSGREIRDLLYRKAAEGVEILFLHNNLIGRNIPRSYFRDFRRHGIKVLPFTHLRTGFEKWLMRINHQNHRKIVIIDGKVAYTGGMNLNDNYFYKWRDTHLRIAGPVIARLQVSFMDSWIESGGDFGQPLDSYFQGQFEKDGFPSTDKLMQIVTDAPEFPFPTTLRAYEWILSNARRYVYLQTPYFVPPPSLMEAMKKAAGRGVDVQLMVPDKVDTPLVGPINRSYYSECLAWGIKLFERGGSFIHSKMLVADDELTVIGTSNLDERSFNLNCEANTFIYDSATAIDCRSIFVADKADARELSLPEWEASRTWWDKFKSAFMLLFRKEF